MTWYDEVWEYLGLQIPETYTRETLAQRAHLDKGFSGLVQEFLDDQERKERLWAPAPVNATGREVKISGTAPTAPGSTRANSRWSDWDANTGTWSSGSSGAWQTISATYYQSYFAKLQWHIDPGRKIKAAAEDDDEPIEPGFVSTGARDDFAVNAAHYGLKPGTPEFHEKTVDWIDEEKWDRYTSGSFDHGARVAVRDARLERYAQSGVDALIEEMMDL